MRKMFNISIICLLMLITGNSFAKNDFPGREKFPKVATYSKTQLLKNFNSVIIVDTRSAYEHSTLRINGAINIPVSSKTFVKEVKLLRETSLKPIVFYCNGRTCFKSYKASKAAQRAGIKQTYAYDAGMFEWAKSNPNKSTLLGKTPLNPNDIIDNKKYKKHMISAKEFGKRAFDIKDKSLILDIRDSYQKAASIGLFMGKERWASIDNPSKLTNYIREAKAKKQPIYIYDEVGKQVRWIQYALEQHKVSNYYFMEKGARGYLKTMIYNR